MSDERKAGDASPEAARAPDPYQAQYMASGALYHDKIRAPLLYHLLFLLPLAIVLSSAITAGIHGGPVAMLPTLLTLVVLPIAWLLFSVLRVSVTRDEVYVQYGLFGPNIAIRDVERCAAVEYDWKRYGGWGIRYGRDGSVAYNMMGDGGRAVEIIYRKGGRSRRVLVASPDPERLAAAVNRAREMALAEGAPRRIGATEGEGEEKDEITREAEAEAIAAEAEAEARRRGA